MRQRILIVAAGLAVLCLGRPAEAMKKKKDPKIVAAVGRALDYLAREQRRQGYWEANQSQYRVAMTALAGNAMLAEGSTTTRGKYSKNIRLAVDYLLDMAQPQGLIGFKDDYHYTYGHGFSMLFLSQVFGEEEDAERRADLKRVLIKAVEFSAQAQTERGGWGYVSAKDQPNFDEGSTCITQVQGLRACRNAGIPVPKEIIEKAKKYIQDCTTPEGGVQYSIRGGRLGHQSRPPRVPQCSTPASTANPTTSRRCSNSASKTSGRARPGRTSSSDIGTTLTTTTRRSSTGLATKSGTSTSRTSAKRFSASNRQTVLGRTATSARSTTPR